MGRFRSLFFVFLPATCLLASIMTSGCDRIGIGRGKKFWTSWWTPGDTVDNVGYKPDQPLPFSHKLHAGDKKIPCQYCHSAARRSETAGIPPVNTCMGCHRLVAVDRDPIKYIQEKYAAHDPIVWTKVHDMPDFVRFTHKRHVQAGVACETCHGDVAKMDTAEQKAPLQMGWCVECHMQKGAPTACYTCHY